MKLKANKKIIGLSLSLVIASVFLLVSPARADWGLDLLSGICNAIVSALGWILIKLMGILVYFAQYNSFIQSSVVSNGWVIVRDVCNMFFVLILLIIAFATILRIEEYNYKKWLPKLILMAILINFSKMICGLLIDAAQIIMLTFVNSFKDVAGANLTNALGIQNWQKIKDDSGSISDYEVAAALVLAVIYVIISIIVITAMLAMIAMRIVMLWIYIVLSPAAYLMSAFPAGKKYAGQWWSQFTQNLIVGPVLAFFIWLSFTSLASFDNRTFVSSASQADVASGANSTATSSAESTPFGTSDVMVKFIVAIGLLLGGMKITQEIGGVAGSAAGKVFSKGNALALKGGKALAGGVGAVTGYNYASGVVKSYVSQRKAKREESYRVGAERLAGGIGSVKKAAVAPINQSAAWIKNKTYGQSGVEAEKLAKEAKAARTQADINNTSYRRKENLKDEKTGEWEYDKATKKWKNKTGLSMSDEKMGDSVKTKTQELDISATEMENKSKEARTRQNKIDKIAKYGMIGAGVATAALTGGIGGVALGAGVGLGIPKLGDKIKHAGEKDLNIASNWRLRQVTEAKDKMKTDSNADVLATMDNSSKSAFVRAAAAMEAIDRDLLSSNDARNKKEEIRDSLGGANSKGEWKDKKLGSYVTNSLEKHYPSAVGVFDDLNHPDLMSSDPKKKAAAEEKKMMAEKTIKDRYEQGVYSLDLDTGTLEKSINFLSNTLRNGEFVRQFKALKSQTKKDSIVRALQTDDSQGAKEKLALVKDLKFAFGADQAGKEEALGKYSLEDLTEVFRKGTADQQSAIVEAVSKKSTKSERLELFTNAKRELVGTSPAMTDMRTKLGVE